MPLRTRGREFGFVSGIDSKNAVVIVASIRCYHDPVFSLATAGFGAIVFTFTGFAGMPTEIVYGGISLVAFIPAVGVLLCLVMLFVPGTKSANRYGAPTHFFKPHMSYAGT